MTLNYMSSVWVAVPRRRSALDLAALARHAWAAAAGLAGRHHHRRLCGRGAHAAAQLQSGPGLCRHARPHVGHGCRVFAYMQVVALAHRRARNLHRVHFATGSALRAASPRWSPASRHGRAGRRRLLPIGVTASIAQLCLDQGLRPGQELARDAGGGQSAVLRHHLRRDLGHGVLRRPHPVLRLGRHVFIIASGIAATILRSRNAPMRRARNAELFNHAADSVRMRTGLQRSCSSAQERPCSRSLQAPFVYLDTNEPP